MIKEIKDNHLFLGWMRYSGISKRIWHTLVRFSVTEIRTQCRAIREEFLSRYENTRAAYASKAFNTLAMLRLIDEEGLSLDVVSGGELYTAIQAGFPAEQIEFNGNNKSIDELALAIDYGVGRIIVDGSQEIGLIRALCQEKQRKAKVMFRITPEVNVQTHAFISTGQKDSKFGIPLDEEIFISFD